MPRFLLGAVLVGTLLVGCPERPLFEPDGLHHYLHGRYVAHLSRTEAKFQPELVCLRPAEPLCVCELNEVDQAVLGLPRGDRLDLNTASAEELETLPGVGPAIARRIIARRAERSFAGVEDLLDVNGIGPGRFRRLLPLVQVRVKPPTAATTLRESTRVGFSGRALNSAE